MVVKKLDEEALDAQRDAGVPKVGPEKVIPVWERDDAPKGSTSESLLEYDHAGRPVRVAEPTHYQHLANGRVVPGYSGGTHYTESVDGKDVIVPIVAGYEG